MEYSVKRKRNHPPTLRITPQPWGLPPNHEDYPPTLRITPQPWRSATLPSLEWQLLVSIQPELTRHKEEMFFPLLWSSVIVWNLLRVSAWLLLKYPFVIIFSYWNDQLLVANIPTELMSHLGEHSVLSLESRHQLSPESHSPMGLFKTPHLRFMCQTLGSWVLTPVTPPPPPVEFISTCKAPGKGGGGDCSFMLHLPRTQICWSLTFCSPFYLGVNLVWP